MTRLEFPFLYLTVPLKKRIVIVTESDTKLSCHSIQAKIKTETVIINLKTCILVKVWNPENYRDYLQTHSDAESVGRRLPEADLSSVGL